MFARTNASFENEDRSDVVLIHGMIVSGNYMMPLARRIAADFRVYVPDFPGYGRSDRPEEILNLTQLADALADWMDGNNLAKTSLIANSFGCQVAAEFSVRYPAKIDRLILQGPTVDPNARTFLKQLIRLKINSFRESKSVGMISAKDYHSAGIKRVIQTIRLTLKDRVEEKLPYIQAPTLIVRGNLDPVVPDQWAREATSLLPRGELKIIEGAAHTLNYSEPDKFAEVIKPFLNFERRMSGI
jgi:pimeloyl-ACP methyl ester carboxylesterase